eukprot:Hpha_TRINITY_DN15756_c4_g4::TRINITY_DN15756_c4_g4_i2::g.39933::m.39933
MRTLPLLLLAARVELGSAYYTFPGGLCPSDVQLANTATCKAGSGGTDPVEITNIATRERSPPGCFREVVDVHAEPNCPWLTTSGRENEMECWDGSYCDVTTGSEWSCCSGKGGRKRCPPHRQYMCARANGCAGGTDYCCGNSCSNNDGNKPCTSSIGLWFNPLSTASVQPSASWETICSGNQPSPSVSPSTSAPSVPPSTSAPSVPPSTSPPSVPPSVSPPTVSPSVSPSTSAPTVPPSTSVPTVSPSTSPSTSVPTVSPSTSVPTVSPSTSVPTVSPSTSVP